MTRTMTTYTSALVAAELGISPRRVLALAVSRKLGRRFGPVWQFTAADLAAMHDREPRHRPGPNPSPAALYRREYRARKKAQNCPKTAPKNA